MRIFKQVFPLLAGLVLFLIANALLSYCLIPNQFTRVKIHKVETETYDDLILGSSHGCSAIDPSVLTEASGRTGYNAAAGGQNPKDSYYLLLSACRSHTPGRLILEYDPSYWLFSDSFNANSRYQLSVMENSFAKLAYFADTFSMGDLRYVLMPWSLYSISAEKIRENVAEKRSGDYRSYSTKLFESASQFLTEDGLIAISDDANGEKSIPELSFEGKAAYVRENREAFERILKMCRDRGIEVIVVTTPVPEETRAQNEDFYREAHGIMKELAGAYGVRYLDFAAPEEGDVTAACNNDWDGDSFSDAEGHMRLSGARRFTTVLRDLL